MKCPQVYPVTSSILLTCCFIAFMRYLEHSRHWEPIPELQLLVEAVIFFFAYLLIILAILHGGGDCE